MTNKKTLVSFVTVTYNAGADTIRTIESVKTQGVRFEHIVVDGGSSDDVTDLIKGAIDDRHLFTSESDRGIYDAMNKGIDRASGDFIVIINAGDTLTHGYTARAIEFLANNPEYDIVYGGVAEKYTQNTIDESFFLYHFNINHQSFVSRSLCYKDKGRFSLDMLVASDIDWTQRALRTDRRFYYLCDNALTFEPGGTSSMARLKDVIIQENCHLIRKQFPFLSSAEAETLYLLRFSPQQLEAVLRIIRAHSSDHPHLIDCISKYLQHLLKHEAAYCNSSFHDYSTTPPLILKACKLLGIDPCIIANPFFTDRYKQAQRQIQAAKQNKNKLIIHYVFNHGTPTETFIRELIASLQESSRDIYTHLILCDNINKDYSPGRNEEIVHIPYKYMSNCLTQEIYQNLFDEALLCVVHFSLNSYKLLRRLDEINLELPFIHMLHGIDVFEMFRDSRSAYREMILNIAHKSNHLFTAPSRYLREKAILAGIPSEKIKVLANSYRPSIGKQSSRKAKAWSRGSGVLNILSLGRMIQWKDHITLARSLEIVSARFNDLQINWTNVSGGSTETLADVESLFKISKARNISFVHISYVDLDRNPDFFSEYDLFIQPSKYDANHPGEPTESFGVSVLEAIVCGLPVIVSDAGGMREILEIPTPSTQTNNFKIFAAGDPISLANQVEDFIMAPLCQHHEQARAVVRDHYSPPHRNSNLFRLISAHGTRKPRVAMVTTQTHGGAGGAAYRLWKYSRLTKSGYDLIVKGDRRDSNLFYRDRDGIIYSSTSIHDTSYALEQNTPGQYEVLRNHTIFSVDEQHLSLDQLSYIARTYDVVNLHWTARFISRGDIAFLTRNGTHIVITVRDMQHIAGGCHYFHGCTKFNADCCHCPQFSHVSSDYAKNAMTNKISGYNHSLISYVFLSNFNNNLLKDSQLVRRSRSAAVIPNGFSRSEVIPTPSAKISDFVAGIQASEVKTILFLPSFTSSVKGNSLLLSALNLLHNRRSLPFQLIIVKPDKLPELNLPPSIKCRYISPLAREKLVDLYAAVDFVIVPSIEETFSNTCAEALICGTPVIGCPTGAIPEMILPGITGELAADFSPVALADAIERALCTEYHKNNCKNHILDNFSQIAALAKYKTLFASLYQDITISPRKKASDILDLDLFSLKFSANSQFPKPRLNIGAPLHVISSNAMVCLNKPLRDPSSGDMLYFDLRDILLKVYMAKFNNSLPLSNRLNLEGIAGWSFDREGLFIQSDTSRICLLRFSSKSSTDVESNSDNYLLLRDMHLVVRRKSDDNSICTLDLAPLTIS